MFAHVMKDIANYGDSPGERGSVVGFALDFGPQALVAYRCARWVRGAVRRPSRWIPALLLAAPCLVMTAFARIAYDIHLDSSADIGPGLRLFHFGGVLLRECTLGDRCVVHHQVRIEPLPLQDLGPRIGSRVWIGPHARIVGPVTIGDGATIGGGAVVTHDVPAGALVAGNPARTTLIHYDNSALL